MILMSGLANAAGSLRAIASKFLDVSPVESRPADHRPVVDTRIYERRSQMVNDLLSNMGTGMEIGAGASPHKLPVGVDCIYFDKLVRGQLENLFGTSIQYPVHPIEDAKSVFENGSPFLIAHNVLEHSADPISTLIFWMSLVAKNGLIVLSIPAKEHCPPDSMRAVPPPEHLLMDYLIDNTEDAFESREHIFSFLAGWRDYIHPESTKSEFLDHQLSEALRSGHDLHWHALDTNLAEFIVYSASILSKRMARIVRRCTYESEQYPTLGETILAIRLDSSEGVSSLDESYRRAQSAIGSFAGRLTEMAGVLDRSVSLSQRER